MADIFSKQKRSLVMAAVKDRGSLIEREVALLLRHVGVRTKRHSSRLPGKPDFSSSKRKFVIFVDSCFWHGCRYHGSMPESNKVFWARKIARNKERDREINREYKRLGWRVIRIWEHNLRNGSPEKMRKLLTVLSKR